VLTFRFALPKDKYFPASFCEFGYIPNVPLAIARDLSRPIADVAFDLPSTVDAMGTPVPETAMNKDACTAAGKYDVRLARKIASVKPET
jgi:hypothetical protein